MSVQEQTKSPDQESEPKRAARPTRHAMIMRGIVTPIFGLLAVASVVLGVLNATMWKPSSEITATSTIVGARYIVTDPGVLSLLDKKVTLSVNPASTKTQTCVALGSSKDVAGWVASESSYMRISGLQSWNTLATQTGKATGQNTATNEADAVAFKDSDMWSQVKCGKNGVMLTSEKTDDSTMAIIDLGKGGGSTGATVSLNWVRSQVPDFAMPFYLSGGLLAVVAILCASVFAMPPHKRRKRMVEGKATIHTDLSFAERAEQGLVNAKLPESAPSRKHRRHASHRRGRKAAEEESVEMTSPVIVDPSARNLVADQQAQAAQEPAQQSAWTEPGAAVAEHPSPAQPLDEQATSVITSDELQAYFARLAQEVEHTDAGESNGEEESNR